VNNIDANGWTPLHNAASIGDYDSAALLIENGAKVNSYSNQQRTPLHLAALNNHVESIALLLMNQAELEW
jgi:ankyrin repeat protein